MMAPDSTSTSAPSSITGALASGCTSASDGGERNVCGSRACGTISYGAPISSISQMIRVEREKFR